MGGRRLAPGAVALLPLLLLAALAAPAVAQPPKNPVCTAVRNAWANTRLCNGWLTAFSNAIYSMTSFVELQVLQFAGAYATGPNYEPSIVQATWEGGYTSSGLNAALQLFQPINLNLVIDGRVPCGPNLNPTKLVTWRALGLNQTGSKPIQTVAMQQANLPAMCSVTPLQQWPYAANATRLPQLWAYLSTPSSGGTVDNSGLYLGCQNYTAAGNERFDGVVSVSCNFIATFDTASSSAAPARSAAALGDAVGGGSGFLPAAGAGGSGGGFAPGTGGSASPAAAGGGSGVSVAGAVAAAMARGPGY